MLINASRVFVRHVFSLKAVGASSDWFRYFSVAGGTYETFDILPFSSPSVRSHSSYLGPEDRTNL